jgi:hypothetical protein
MKRAQKIRRVQVSMAGRCKEFYMRPVNEDKEATEKSGK